MVFRNENASTSAPKPQKVAKQTTMSAKPAAFMAAPTTMRPKRRAPAPVRQAPRPVQNNTRPSVAPVRSNSTGQVSTPSPRHQAMQSRVQQAQQSKKSNNNPKPQSKPTNKYPVQKAASKPTVVPKAVQGKVAPVGAPSIDDYLASDSGYQGGISELMKTLEQFKSGNQSSQQDVQGAFKTAMERMGQEREQSLKSLQEDFASRGLLNSGLYAQANSDYDTQYNQRVGDLTADEQNQLGTLNTDASNFAGLNQTQQAELRAKAIARRADQYNVTA